MAVTRLASFVLVSRDAARLARFFADALGFAQAARQGGDVALTLGPSTLLLENRPEARPYPADVPGWSPRFQHCAIVVDDMAAAHRRLAAANGWTPISTNGPVLLPASSGGVTAFKFRDPEGHPLELLGFPDGKLPPYWRGQVGGGPCLGIDHSALSVANTSRSVAFYEGLGLAVSSRSLNVGPEQARLDGVPDPTVEVTGLAPAGAETPHVELLCYRGDYDRAVPPPGIGDVAATRLMFEVDPASLRDIVGRLAPHVVGQIGQMMLLRDPDGHFTELSVSPRPELPRP